MIDRYREVKRMEEEVKRLREQVHRKRYEVEQLKVNDEARKRAIRQHLNKALPGETTIILPPEPQSGSDASSGQ
jgi:cell division protein FtsB